MLNFFDFSTHLESFWSVFEANAATYSSNNVLHKFRFLVLTVLEPITKTLGNCQEIASKRQKF